MKSIVIFLGVLLFSSCSHDQSGESQADVAMMVDNVPEPQEEGAPSSPPRSLGSQNGEISKTETARKLIREGEIAFETSDPDATKKQIEASAASANAYISSDQQAKFSDRLNYTMVVRIPASKFDSFLASVTKGVDYFDKKEINVKDVTAEYLDSESRIKTKKELEARYLQLLGKASSVKDILEIEKELGAIRTEIEATEGQLKYLKDQVQYSTLRIAFYKITSSPAVFSHQISSAFGQGWENLLTFLLLIVNLWPFLLLFPIFWIGIKRLKKRISKKKISESV